VGTSVGLNRLIIVIAAASLAFGADQTTLPDFSDLSLEELANIKVTSFTKKEQKLSQVAGAIYVINQEQIARSGLTSVSELLRLVPGVDVAQVNGNQWSVSVRGTVGVYSNKLLVLIDGRSIYTAAFAGVYWDLGMPLLDDIDRIEVIRGPGATIWGANAVLGVINIITKSSRDTHGTTITAGGGSTERAFGSATMGGAFGSMNYRVFFGGADKAPLSQASGAKADERGDTGKTPGCSKETCFARPRTIRE
jgi:iron complex outermembrane receptor protein